MGHADRHHPTRVQAIAIGASAGGIDALTVLLGALPAAARLSVLVVMHLSPSRPSLLPAILAERCALPVLEAQDKMPIEGGTVVVAPPDYHMLVDAGPQIALSADAPVNWSRPAIDVLFESASEQYGAALAGVVLTGASDDGARGLAAIVQAGGVALVQDPASAFVATMPTAAIAHCAQAQVMDLPSMARQLAHFCKEKTA
jgi:two-component system, chemotaxis family, protein-glutamate methylesterase/glutaminase